MREEHLTPEITPVITLTYESDIPSTVQVDRNLDPIISCKECCHYSRLEGDNPRYLCRQHVDEEERFTWVPNEDFQCEYLYPNIEALNAINYFDRIEYVNLRSKARHE